MKGKIKLKNYSAQVILKAALKRGLKVEVISERFSLLKVSCNPSGKSLFVKGTSYPANPQPSCVIANNKFLTKKVLRKANVPVPKSWLVKTPREAKEAVSKKNLFPCVLKPTKGAHGKQVFVNIESIEEFEEVLPLVFTKPGGKDVLLEQYIEGKEHRALVVGKKVSAVMQRIPAHVIGDGKSNIRQLIKKFNQHPLVGKKYEKPMCKIKVNGEVKRNLKKQGKKLTYIPEKEEKVFLRQNSNISTGGIGKDVTKTANQKIKDVALKAARAIGINITGVDIIFNKKLNQPYVLELNDCPGIDIHHYPVMGKPQDVAGDIVDFLFFKEKNV